MTDWVGLGWHILALSLKRDGDGEEDEEEDVETIGLFRWWLFPMVDITEVKRKHDPFGKCTCFQSALHC